MNRIKQIRESQDLTQAALAELLGPKVNGATVQRIESGKRKLTELWLRRIAQALNVQPYEILGDIIPPTTLGLLVKGEVEAGVWRQKITWDEQRYRPLPIGKDPRYPNSDQYALLFMGTSMNKIVNEGQYVVCAPWADVGRDIRDQDLVIVHHRRHDTTESSMKRVKISKGKVTLVPESTDPKWQATLAFPCEVEHEEISIVARVLGRYQAFD